MADYKPDVSSLPLDPFWEFAPGFDSHDDFEALADSVAFREEVPVDVVGRFDFVRRALRLSAIDVHLMEAALERSMLTLEMALRHLRRELTGSKSSGHMLGKLIDWAGKAHLFENGPQAVKGLRDFRNKMVAHVDHHWRLTYLSRKPIEDIVFLINGLYEDPDLRAARNAARAELKAAFEALGSDGVLLDGTGAGGERLICFDVDCLHVENRGLSQPLYFVSVWPIFDPSPIDERGTVDYGEPITFEAEGWTKTARGINFFALDDATPGVRVEAVVEARHLEQFRLWREGLEATGNPADALVDYRKFDLRSDLIARGSNI